MSYCPQPLQIDISYIKETYKLDNYIETGTGFGDSLSCINNFDFKNFFSIELIREVYESAKLKFSHTKFQFLNGNSPEVLAKLLPKINGNTLFYLDAHYPGCCAVENSPFRELDSESDIDKRLPLEIELQTIIDNYPSYTNSVIIIDDLRIYEDGPFEVGNWDIRNNIGKDGKLIGPANSGVEFIFKMFKDTHIIQKMYTGGGSVILTPKIDNEIQSEV